MPILSSPSNSISSLGSSHLEAPTGGSPRPPPTTYGPDSAGPDTLRFSVRAAWSLLFVNAGIPGKPLLFTETRSSSCFCPLGKLSQTYVRKLDLCPPCCRLYRTWSPALTRLHGNGLFMFWSHTLWPPEGTYQARGHPLDGWMDESLCWPFTIKNVSYLLLLSKFFSTERISE